MRLPARSVFALLALLGLQLPAAPASARKREAPGAKDHTVALSVTCATAGASVFVDGELVGYAPLDLPVPVGPGEHTIKVTKLGYAPFIDVFSTKGKSAVALEMELVPVSGV